MPRSPLLPVLLAVATFFLAIGRPAIGDSDEAFYAEAGREMVAGGDWLTPHFNHEYRFQKPVLFYWGVAASYLVAGVHPGSARFCAALSGLGLVLLAWAIARRWRGADAAVLAGVVAATSVGYVALARLALPDLPLAFFVTATIWCLFSGLFDEPGRARRWLLLAAVAAALGFLTKGPLALVLPALVVAPVLLLERGQWRLHWSDAALALVVFGLIGLPWYGSMVRVHGIEYLKNFFMGDNLERFATARFNDPRPYWFYLPILAGGLFPWSPLLLLGIAPAVRVIARRARLSRIDLRLLLWAGLPLIFFSLSIGKQPRYILPVLPPLAVALAGWLGSLIGQRPRDERAGLARAAMALAGAGLVLAAALLWRVRPLLIDVSAWQVGGAAVVMAGGGLFVMALAAGALWRVTPWALAAAATLSCVAVQYTVFTPRGSDAVERMAALVVSHHRPGEPLGCWHVFVRNLVFYTHLPQADVYDQDRLEALLRTPGGALCVIGEEDLREVEREAHLRIERLGSVRYFKTAMVKLRTLVNPVSARDVDTVWLVRSRPR